MEHKIFYKILDMIKQLLYYYVYYNWQHINWRTFFDAQNQEYGLWLIIISATWDLVTGIGQDLFIQKGCPLVSTYLTIAEYSTQ